MRSVLRVVSLVVGGLLGLVASWGVYSVVNRGTGSCARKVSFFFGDACPDRPAFLPYLLPGLVLGVLLVYALVTRFVRNLDR